MHCAEWEASVCDYVDGLMSPAERGAFERHLPGCVGCRAAVEEQRAVLSFLEGVPEIEPPAELITRLIQDSPVHKVAAERAKRGWLRRMAGPLIDPILQPRFAMGMAMTILSFSMLGKFAAPVKQLKPSDLDPVKVWAAVEDKAHRTWERGVKYYDNLRVVWEVRNRLAEVESEPGNAGEAKGARGKDAGRNEGNQR
jgi:anti-sigma factor RsiW